MDDDKLDKVVNLKYVNSSILISSSKGDFSSKIYKTTLADFKGDFILKVCKVNDNNLNGKQSIQQKYSVLKRIDCSFIVKVYSIFTGNHNLSLLFISIVSDTFTEEPNSLLTINVLMEFCDGGTLKSAIQNKIEQNSTFCEMQIALWISQILAALLYMKSQPAATFPRKLITDQVNVLIISKHSSSLTFHLNRMFFSTGHVK